MNVIEFFRVGGDKPEIFACGKCGQHWARDRSIAEKCCTKGVCERCGRDDLPTYWATCSTCRELNRFDAAEKIAAKDHNGPVEWNDCFFADVGELMAHYEGEDEVPKYAYACEVHSGVGYDPADVIESMCADMPEDSEVEDEAGLFAFFEQWNAKQCQTWWESTSTVVLLDWSEDGL